MSKNNKSFVFVIPVRNPEDDKVQDYNCIEAVLRATVRSLTQQTYQDTHIVIVCHRIPSWSTEFGEHLTFLDVSGLSVFPPNDNPVQVDKGLKYIIGILYAKTVLDPALIMPMDSDDYINIQLAQKLIKKKSFLFNKDGFLISKGLHVSLNILSDYSIEYEAAYLVERFHRTCGSCRIFKMNALMKKFSTLDVGIVEKFSHWPPRSPNASIKVPLEPVLWLSDISKPNYLNDDSIVNILGRHVRQDSYFNFSSLSFIGAAKGCGHGNHDGPRAGEIHQDKLLKSFSTEDFYKFSGVKETQYPT